MSAVPVSTPQQPPRLPLAAWMLPEPNADNLMRAVALMLLAYVWRLQDAFPVLGKIQLPLIAAAMALAFYAADRHPLRRFKQLRSPILTLVGVLLLLMVAGVPVSLVRGVSAMFVVKSYLPNLVLMVLVACSVRSERDLEWYARMNVYGAAMYATLVNLFFHVGPDGRLGDLVYYDANDFALIMVCSLPFAVYFVRSAKGTGWRPLGLIALALFMIGIVKSGSRGGFLALIAVILYVMLRYRSLPARVRLTASALGIALLVGLGSTKYWDMMRTILHPQSDYNWSGESGRREVWKRGIGYMVHNPVFGVGVRTFPTAEGRLSVEGQEATSQGRGFKWSVAHNSFVETGAELGIPGLCVFIGVLAVTFLAMYRLSMRRPRPPTPWVTVRLATMAQMLTGSLIGFCIAGFFVSAEYFSYLYFMLGFAVGLVKIAQVRQAAMQAAPPEVRFILAAQARMTAAAPRRESPA